MERDHSPLERCKDCGFVTAVLVYEQGLDDNGDYYRAMWRDVTAHPQSECLHFQALAREEWPSLW